MATDRFRRVYGKTSQGQKDLVEAIKLKAEELEALYEQIEPTLTLFNDPGIELAPARRLKALGITALEESVMWAVKAATS